jgi:hypothetical protein
VILLVEEFILFSEVGNMGLGSLSVKVNLD